MPRITLLIGVLLAFVGIFFFLYTNSEHPTALIPAGFGAVFMLLGLLAAVEHLRKHMMHAAAALAALGFIFGVVRIILALARGPEIGPAFIETAIFAGLCGLLLILCVKSFIDARRRRSQQISS
jgi:drug/metabolite transporter (DMT)-like permease